MRLRTKMLAHLAAGAVALSCLPATVLSAAAQQASQPAAGTYQAPSSTQQSSSPDQQAGTQPQTAAPAPSSNLSNEPPPQAPEPQPPQTPQQPLGTATAESPNVSGIAASQPAGVAIAPAKQRRVRTIVLKVGALVGAGVAVGTVIGLTRATSSKPPGAH